MSDQRANGREEPALPTTFRWDEFLEDFGKYTGHVGVPPTIQIPKPPEAPEEQE